MRKILLSLTTAVVTLFANAQDPNTNGGFENWTPVPNTSAENPTGWATFNNFATAGWPVGVQKTTDANSGQFAMLVKNGASTVPLTLLGVPKDTLPGFTSFGSLRGASYTQRPTSFRVFVKHTAELTDSSIIAVNINKFGLGAIGAAATAIIGPATDYLEINVPITYTDEANPNTPDTVVVVISSYAGFPLRLGQLPYNPNPAQELYIDDFELIVPTDTTNSVNDPMFGKSLNIFPNPVANNLFIDAYGFDFTEPTVVEITDLMGRTVKTQEMLGKLTNVSVSNLNNGLYIYRVVQGTTLMKSGKFTVAN